MKTDGVGGKIYDDIIASTHTHQPVKKIKMTAAPVLPERSSNAELATSIEQADKIAAGVSEKLHKMAVLVQRMENEKNDIIRAQIARYFNVLRTFIDDALHPTGDASADRFLSGESVDMPNINTPGAIQGERISLKTKLLDISELPKNARDSDVDFICNAINRAQSDVDKLRNNLVKARVQIEHLSHGLSEITL